MLLSKPISRTGFLLGKYAGLLMALAVGMVVLTLILLGTYWWSFGLEAMDTTRFKEDVANGRTSVGGFMADFFLRDGVLILQGSCLAFLQVTLLTGAVIACAAFFPIPVSASISLLIYILSNMTGYIRQAAAASESAILVWAGRVLYYVFPNLGYLNLQHALSEGEPIRAAYLLYAFLYTGLYLGVMMSVVCGLFSRREIR
jgi:ABC-type Na+ efflux pump permease subunit